MSRDGDRASHRSRIEKALRHFDSNAPWDPPFRSTYALADALLGIECDRPTFHGRFEDNYRECAVPIGSREPDLVFRVRTLEEQVVLATCSVTRGAPLEDFPGVFLPARTFEGPSDAAPWRVADLDHPVGSVAYGPAGLVAALETPWEALFASVAVNRALSTQPGIMFFHGAAVGVHGKGVLLLGVSGAGKTSVSLALAARGHDFYGDDIVGVRLDSRGLVPLRRAAHVRRGPMAPGVAEALERVRGANPTDRLAQVSLVFPRAGSAALDLDVVVCLRSFAEETRLKRFSPRAGDLRWVTPHVGSLHAGRPGDRAMRVVSFFSSSTCFFLDSASPESAADALEKLTE